MAILTIGGKLYQIALLETDPVDSWYASLSFVILDRSEDYDSKSNGERAALRDALTALDNLRRMTDRAKPCSKRIGRRWRREFRLPNRKYTKGYWSSSHPFSH
jgi:hypothetical protein